MINRPQVETYIEVALIYNEAYTMIKKTNIDEGSTPKWNEVLQFDLVSQDSKGFTKEELMNSNTTIMISLFDKRTDYVVLDGKKITQEENRYLGSVSVPLLTILCSHEKCDTNFRL